MLTGVDPPLDGAVVLLEHVVQIWHRPMPAILGEGASGFELRDGGRVRGVTVGVDDTRHGMVLPPQRFAQEALCCSRVLLGREEKVEGRARRIHRTIQVAPLALDPDVGLVHPPTVSGRFESRAQTSFHFRGVTLHPSLQTVTWSTKSPRSARRSSTSRYDSEKRKYQPT